jgi:hypothetical protein
MGTIIQVGAGVFNVDLPADVRDLSADVMNWEWSKSHIKQTLLDGIGLLPIIGALKYGDEAADVVKSGSKTADKMDEVKEVGEKVVKGGKNSILSYEDAEDIAFSAIKGSKKADTVVLGKYGDGGPTAYTSVAKDMDAQYFQLDNWDELASKYSDDEIWKINQKFLDIQTSSGREIYLSHNPADYIGDGSFYSREIEYLLDNGYELVDEGGVWHAIR